MRSSCLDVMMRPPCSLVRSCRLCSLLPVLGSLLLVLACASRSGTAHTSNAAAKGWSGTLTAAGIPAQSDLLTVVPLLHPKSFEHQGLVLFEADVDGHRGIFVLDTGSPNIGFNSRYIKRRSIGGIDTLLESTKEDIHDEDVTVHTVRIGTIVARLDSVPLGPPIPWDWNADVEGPGAVGLLGNLGLNVMENFETIIDYTNQRLVLIRLDSTGHRMVQVPEYSPIGTLRLLPVGWVTNPVHNYWGVLTHRGTKFDTLLVDTGSPGTDTTDEVSERAADQIRKEFLVGHAPTSIDLGDDGRKLLVPKMLCYQFLHRLGVVGFNLRTHQLISYR